MLFQFLNFGYIGTYLYIFIDSIRAQGVDIVNVLVFYESVTSIILSYRHAMLKKKKKNSFQCCRRVAHDIRANVKVMKS